MLKKDEYIEFDIELAKQGREVRTRQGQKVKILTFDAKSEKPIVALIQRLFNHNEEYVNTYYFNGKDYKRQEKSSDDLVIMREKPQKTFVGYANLYTNGQLGEVFKTEKEAKDCLFSKENYVATIKIEY